MTPRKYTDDELRLFYAAIDAGKTHAEAADFAGIRRTTARTYAANYLKRQQTDVNTDTTPDSDSDSKTPDPVHPDNNLAGQEAGVTQRLDDLHETLSLHVKVVAEMSDAIKTIVTDIQGIQREIVPARTNGHPVNTDYRAFNATQAASELDHIADAHTEGYYRFTSDEDRREAEEWLDDNWE